MLNFEFRIGEGIAHVTAFPGRAHARKGRAHNGRVGDCGGLGGELNLDYEMGSFRAAFLVAGG